MKEVFNNNMYAIYEIFKGEYIIIDKPVNATVAYFQMRDNFVYHFTPLLAYCLSCHNYYIDAINEYINKGVK